MTSRLSFRWLGIAGIELSYHNQVLLIDPCLTRIPFWRLWYGKLHSDHSLVAQVIPHADHILITHSHYDHLLDAPGLAITHGAGIYGSPNTCALSKLSGVPSVQIHPVQSGVTLDLGCFSVKVIPANHRRIPFFLPGSLSPHLRSPFTARQYRLDLCFSFRISVDGFSLLVNAGSPPHLIPAADVLFLHPFYSNTHYRQLLEAVRPRVAIPVHWDDLWRPLSQPPQPSFQPPDLAFPPLRRVNLALFQQALLRLDPTLQVLLPERLKEYNLSIFGSVLP